MKAIILEALESELKKERPNRVSDSRAKLYASGGLCQRNLILSSYGVEGNEFPYRVKAAMDLGLAYEKSTEDLLKRHFGNVATQIAIKNDFWSVKLDFVVNHLREPIIVEHKATGSKYFDYKGELPQKNHVAQICLYGILYEEQFKIKPVLRLVYRAWGESAEFEPSWDEDGNVSVEGILNDGVYNTTFSDGAKERAKDMNFNIFAHKTESEMFYKMGKIPPRVNDKAAYGCTFNGKPSCRFYDYCWPLQRKFRVQGNKAVLDDSL